MKKGIKMENMINVELPKSLAISLKMDDKEFSDEIKKVAILKLYEMEKISSGIAAKTLGITRINFLELLDKQKISYIDIKDSELEEDIRNA
jgi:predicted HTH domain antitoxin